MRTTQKIILALVSASLAVPGAVVFAEASNMAAVTFDTLGVEKPAILASNPFQGLTDLVRGMSVTLATDRVNRVAALLSQMDRKAAELIQMRAVAPNKPKFISKAFSEYQLAAYQYSFGVQRLTQADFLSNDRANVLADQILVSALIHTRFLDELLTAEISPANQAVLIDVESRLAEVNVKFMQGALGLDATELRLDEITSQGSVGILIRNAEALSLLAKRAIALDSGDVVQTLLAARDRTLDAAAEQLAGAQRGDNIVVGFAKAVALGPAVVASAGVTHFDQETLDLLSSLAGSHGEHLQTISYLLTTKELDKNADLVTLRNRFLIEALSK